MKKRPPPRKRAAAPSKAAKRAEPATPTAPVVEGTLREVLDQLKAIVSRLPPNDTGAVVEIWATSGAEIGRWVVSLRERTIRVGTDYDRPGFSVRGPSDVIRDVFAGRLPVVSARQKGLSMQGAPEVIEQFVRAVGSVVG